MMLTAPFILLAVLAIVDGGFAGYRVAAGRNPLIRKDRYYRRAIRRGLSAGLVTCLSVGATAGLLFAADPSPSILLDLLHSAVLMTACFGLYATLVLIALGVWLVAEADGRTLASVLILGPFTLIRPLCILVTCVAAALTSKTWQGAAAVLIAACAQLALEPWLTRQWHQIPASEHLTP